MVEDKLSSMILEGKIKPGDSVTVTAGEEAGIVVLVNQNRLDAKRAGLFLCEAPSTPRLRIARRVLPRRTGRGRQSGRGAACNLWRRYASPSGYGLQIKKQRFYVMPALQSVIPTGVRHPAIPAPCRSISMSRSPIISARRRLSTGLNKKIQRIAWLAQDLYVVLSSTKSKQSCIPSFVVCRQYCRCGCIYAVLLPSIWQTSEFQNSGKPAVRRG